MSGKQLFESKAEGLILLGLAAVGLAVRLYFTEFTVDDAYITLRYAENLAQGNGFVFNLGERVCGTTTPLFTLLLAWFSFFTDNPLLLGKLVNIIADVGVCLLTVKLGYQLADRKWIGLLAGLLYALNPVTVKWSALGMETGLYTLLVGLSLWQHLQQNRRSSYLYAGLATLTRIDGALVFGILILTDLIRERRGLLINILIGSAPVIVWLVFASLYFGSPIPQSVLAKKVTYGGISAAAGFQLVGLKLLLRNGIITVGASLVALVGLFSGIKKQRGFRPIVAWWFLYWAFFVFGGARMHGWYLAPPVWVYALMIGLGVDWIFRRLEQRIIPVVASRAALNFGRAVVLVGTAVILAVVLRDRYREVKNTIGMMEREVQQTTGLWLKENAQPGDTVCLESIGAVGYYSELYILDLVGLVSPQVVPLNDREQEGPNFSGILQTFKPKYYVWWETWEQDWWIAHPASRAWLDSFYEKKKVFSYPGHPGWAVWQRRPAAGNY